MRKISSFAIGQTARIGILIVVLILAGGFILLGYSLFPSKNNLSTSTTQTTSSAISTSLTSKYTSASIATTQTILKSTQSGSIQTLAGIAGKSLNITLLIGAGSQDMTISNVTIEVASGLGIAFPYFLANATSKTVCYYITNSRTCEAIGNDIG